MCLLAYLFLGLQLGGSSSSHFPGFVRTHPWKSQVYHDSMHPPLLCTYQPIIAQSVILLFPPNHSGRHTLLSPKSRLHCVPKKIGAHPIPEFDLIWKSGLCRCNQITMMSYRIRV